MQQSELINYVFETLCNILKYIGGDATDLDGNLSAAVKSYGNTKGQEGSNCLPFIQP